MRVIVQEHSWGCGVACVAYASGKTYQRSLDFFTSPENAWKCGYTCRQLVLALGSAGLNYQHRYYREKFRSVLKIPGTIVFIARNRKYPGGHYLIRTENGKWMNPWSNFPCIASAKAAQQIRLPGRVQYVIFRQSGSIASIR